MIFYHQVSQVRLLDKEPQVINGSYKGYITLERFAQEELCNISLYLPVTFQVPRFL